MAPARMYFTLPEPRLFFMFLAHVDSLFNHPSRRIYSYPYHESDWSTTSFAASDGVRNFSLNTFAKANDM